jgi:hypothetical protein
MTDPAAVEALAAGFARGVERRLRAERPDLAWEVRVGPIDWAKLARLEARADKARREGKEKR